MKRRTTTQPAEQAAAEARADALLDETLGELSHAPAVDLKARVMAAIAERPERAHALRDAGRWWQPALVLGAAALVVLSVVALWTGWPARTPAPLQSRANAPAPLTSRAATPPASPTQARTPSDPGPAGGEQPAGSSSPLTQAGKPAPLHARASKPAASPTETQAAAVPAEEATGPYLPGAPAGDLGDPLAPMPKPPSIAISPIAQAPIASAPPVSDFARPVTDFPADTPSPDVPTGTTGQSGGTRR